MKKNVGESKNVGRMEIIWNKNYDIACVTFGLCNVFYVVQRDRYWTIAINLNCNLVAEVGQYDCYESARDELVRIIRIAYPKALHSRIDFDAEVI